MIVKEINNEIVLSTLRQSFDLLPGTLDDTLIACCVRRVAGFQCPCSAEVLISTILKSLNFLTPLSETDLKIKIEDVVERLIIAGDLLELSEVSTNDPKVRTTSLFAAHPAYLLRPNGSALIQGIVADENSPIGTLSTRITYQGCKRILTPLEGEVLEEILNGFGLFQKSESTWLKLPKLLSAEEYLSHFNDRLASTTPAGDIDGLLILNSAKRNSYYRGRWTDQGKLTGRFVAKRPAQYGIYIWCYAELSDGKVIKFIDIPYKQNGINQRGCDGGWHLQMSIDHCAGFPQVYDVRLLTEGMVFDFSSPLPFWAERRFIVMGKTLENQPSLISYLIPEEEALASEEFLRKYLWLSKNNKD